MMAPFGSLMGETVRDTSKSVPSFLMRIVS